MNKNRLCLVLCEVSLFNDFIEYISALAEPKLINNSMSFILLHHVYVFFILVTLIQPDYMWMILWVIIQYHYQLLHCRYFHFQSLLVFGFCLVYYLDSPHHVCISVDGSVNCAIWTLPQFLLSNIYLYIWLGVVVHIFNISTTSRVLNYTKLIDE